MNKKVMICIGIIFLVVLFVVLTIVIPNITGSKELELTYKTTGGVPYKWEYKIEDESIVELVKIKGNSSNENMILDGEPIEINYVFKGLKEGKTNITFKYINITNNSIEKEEKVTVKVDKYKNISLIAVPRN